MPVKPWPVTVGTRPRVLVNGSGTLIEVALRVAMRPTISVRIAP